jgi:hypothetical protein
MDNTLSTYQVMAVAGATYRQVDYWCRTGSLDCHRPARGSGTQRRFTGRQAATAWIFARLAEMGAQQPVLRRAATALAADESLWNAPVVVEAGRGGRVLSVYEAGERAGWVVDPRAATAALRAYRGSVAA